MKQMNILNETGYRYREQTCSCQGEGESGEGKDWEFEISRCKLLYIGWINYKVMLYSTENYNQYSVIKHNQFQFSCSVESDSSQPHEMQHARHPCLSPTPGAYFNSCPSSQ